MATHPTPTAPRPVDRAVAALREFGDDLSREQATTLLSMWRGRWTLSNQEAEHVLLHFRPLGTR